MKVADHGCCGTAEKDVDVMNACRLQQLRSTVGRPVWMKGPSLPAISPPAIEQVTPISLNTSVFRLSRPACHAERVAPNSRLGESFWR